MKKLLNLHEEAARRRLQEVCRDSDAEVFAKIRLADVLPIENSGISGQEYRFALQAHFDFVVVDKEQQPLFAVEFDGPGHASSKQRQRDAFKNSLCARFSLPLLRINARYIPRKYRGMDLLSWLVEVWFLEQAFNQAQAEGSIPWEEGFDPIAIASMSSRDGSFPLWLSIPVQDEIANLHKTGRCVDHRPSYVIAVDEKGTYRAAAWLMLDKSHGVLAWTAMRNQQFPVNLAEALEQIVLFELQHELDAVLNDRVEPFPNDRIEAHVRSFQKRFRMCRAAFTGNFAGLGDRQRV